MLRRHCLSSVALSLPRCSRPVVCTHAAAVLACPFAHATASPFVPFPPFALPLAQCFQLNPATPAVFQPLLLLSISITRFCCCCYHAAAAAASPPHAAAAHTRRPVLPGCLLFPPFFSPSHSICARLLLLLTPPLLHLRPLAQCVCLRCFYCLHPHSSLSTHQKLEGKEAEWKEWKQKRPEEARRKREIPSPYDRINIYQPKKPYLISPFSFATRKPPKKKKRKKKKKAGGRTPTYQPTIIGQPPFCHSIAAFRQLGV